MGVEIFRVDRTFSSRGFLVFGSHEHKISLPGATKKSFPAPYYPFAEKWAAKKYHDMKANRSSNSLKKKAKFH